MVAWILLLIGPLLAGGAPNNDEAMQSLLASVEKAITADSQALNQKDGLSAAKWMTQQVVIQQKHASEGSKPEPPPPMGAPLNDLPPPEPLGDPDLEAPPPVSKLEKIVRTEEQFDVPVAKHPNRTVSSMTAAMVDSVLLSKAELIVSSAEEGDPLLADPLVSLEDEEEDENVTARLEEIKAKAGVPRFDLKEFSDDTIRKMDTNNDGLLSQAELRDHLQVLIDKARAQELIEEKANNAEGIKEIIER
jgi:hypothetical protein